MHSVHLIAGIAWNPQIRGYLTVATAVAILMGSVYLILSTNLAHRLGFLVAATAFFGWMMIMGATWWIYGIGMKGTAPHWDVKEIVVGDLGQARLPQAEALNTSKLPDPKVLSDATPDKFITLEKKLEPTLGGGWTLLAESNPARGEAQAVVDATLKTAAIKITKPDGTQEPIDSTSAYLPIYAFEQGGKAQLPNHPNRLDRIEKKLKTITKLKHPPRYAIIQVQPVVPQVTVVGQAPPAKKVDKTAPVISIILERNLGSLRLPSFLIMLGSGAIFGLLCNVLHRRDRLVAAALSAAPATAGS